MKHIKQPNMRLNGYKFYLKALNGNFDIEAISETPVQYNITQNGHVIFTGKYKEIDAFLDGIDFALKWVQ